MKYRTLLYHSKWWDGKWIDNAITIVTRVWHLFRRLWKRELRWKEFWRIFKMGFSHEEIWIPDEDGGFSYACSCYDMPLYCSVCFIGGKTYKGTCYTSTMGQVRGKNNVGNGTCKRNASNILKHPERWSYTEHEVSDRRYVWMIHYLEDQVAKNKGYGLGPDKNVCSELSHNANVTSGELAGPYRFISPLGDALRLVKSGKEIIPLKG